MYDIGGFGLKEMTACGVALRSLGEGARSMEEVAERLVRHLYDQLAVGAAGVRAALLVRFYKTHDYGRLEPPLQAFAARLTGGPTAPDVKCLTLLATAGDEPDWNRRDASRGHQAIPIPSAEVVGQLPMVAALVREFGLGISDVVHPNPDLMVQLGQRSFNVFHVAEAEGSPYIPAQADFVRAHGVKSALGFGGMLPSGDLFAVVLFSRVAIPRETATLFQTVALNAKLAVLPFAAGPVFRSEVAGAARRA